MEQGHLGSGFVFWWQLSCGDRSAPLSGSPLGQLHLSANPEPSMEGGLCALPVPPWHCGGDLWGRTPSTPTIPPVGGWDAQLLPVVMGECE